MPGDASELYLMPFDTSAGLYAAYTARRSDANENVS